MKVIKKLLTLFLLASDVTAFVPSKSHQPAISLLNDKELTQTSSISSPLLTTNKKSASAVLYSSKSTEGESGFFTDLTINPIYASLWALFLSVATYFSVTETSGASQALIESFIADPLNPGFGSSLFETEWNAIGLIGLPLATLIMPGAKGQKLNPTPFLFASSFAGFGSLGIFMMTRKPVPSVNINDLGWFTKNVLENKIFNLIVFLVLTNAYIISGAGEAMLKDAVGTLVEFKNMIGGSALGTATTVDFSILCLTGASLIPEDLRRRGVDVESNKAKFYAIAASTLLLPAAGLALYSTLRPNLVEE